MRAAKSVAACCLGVKADIVLIGEKRIELSVDKVFKVRVETSVELGGEVVDKLVGSSEVSVRFSWRGLSGSTLEPASLIGLVASWRPSNILASSSTLRGKTGKLYKYASLVEGEL